MKWAVKHECEELKEGAWLEPGLALLRKKVKENWTETHRNAARKIFLEGGWTQTRLFDIGACQLEEGTERHRLYHLSRMARNQAKNSRGLQKVGTKGENVEERVEVAKRYCYAPSK